MPPIDVDQLLAADDFATLSVGSVAGASQTNVFTGLGDAGAVAVMLANLGGVRTPIDLTVEGSSDGGSSWSTLGTLAAVIMPDAILIDSPPDAIRVSLAGDADTVEVRLRPFRSGGNGGSQPNAVTLLGPFRINYNDADLDNPETGNGLQTLAIPADSLVRVVVVFRTEWVGAVAGDQLAIGVAPLQSGSDLYLCGYDLGNSPADHPEIGFIEGQTLSVADGATNAGDVPRSAFVVVDCHVFVAMYAAGPITAGSADVYALVATPS